MKRSWYLHPIIWGRRDRDALPFIIFIKFLLKFKDSLSLFNLPSVRHRLFSMMCCISSDPGISPPSLDSSRALHSAWSPSCFFNIPLLKFNLPDQHFMYFRSEARHPVFVNFLCLASPEVNTLDEWNLLQSQRVQKPGDCKRRVALAHHVLTEGRWIYKCHFTQENPLREQREGMGSCQVDMLSQRKQLSGTGEEQDFISSMCC